VGESPRKIIEAFALQQSGRDAEESLDPKGYRYARYKSPQEGAFEIGEPEKRLKKWHIDRSDSEIKRSLGRCL